MLLSVRNLFAYYNGVRALSGVSLSTKKGEVVALIGANGAGKSTVLRAVSGLLKRVRGEVLFNGRPVVGLPPEKLVKMGMSHVPEGRQIFGPLTVLENLEMGAYLRFRARGSRDVTRDLERVYSLFPVLEERANQDAGTLSGGEQQMLAIGRALMSRPRLLLLDEPTLGLAPKLARLVMETIAKLKAQGLTMLMVEQNARAALRVADRGYVLETGRVLITRDAGELLADPQVKRAYLGKDYRVFYEDRA